MTNELLDHDRQNKKYNITAKGLEFLDAYNKMADLLKLPDLSASPSKF